MTWVIRNSLVQQYQPLDQRADRSALWENFLITERFKYLENHMLRPNRYFWRTHDQQEIDYLEDMDGQLTGYEIKWQAKKRKAPVAFADAYPNSSLHWVDQENFEAFITAQT